MSEKKFKLLIVDDESDLLDILATRLELSGYQIFTAANGKIALEVIAKEIIDLVITDVQMPILTGVQLLENVRQKDPNFPPIIFITGYTAITIEQAFDKGVQAVFYKPFDFKDLLACIKKFLVNQQDRFQTREIREAISVKLNFHGSTLKMAQEAHMLNIGNGGFFMSLDPDKLPGLNSKIEFNIEFQEERSEIKGTGIVRWVRKEFEEDMPPGCGIEFDEMDQKSKDLTKQLINSIRTGKYIPRF